MALADDLKPIVTAARAIPGELGLRPYSVAVVSSTWSGDHPGDGTEVATITNIREASGQNPKVRFLNEEQRALGGLPVGSATVGPITPDHTGGGTSFATLVQLNAAAGTTVLFRLTGPQHPTGALYELHEARSDRALHYMLTLKPVAEK